MSECSHRCASGLDCDCLTEPVDKSYGETLAGGPGAQRLVIPAEDVPAALEARKGKVRQLTPEELANIDDVRNHEEPV